MVVNDTHGYFTKLDNACAILLKVAFTGGVY